MIIAEVYLWGERVGVLANSGSSRYATFEYDPAWLETGIEISPFYLPAREGKFQFRGLNYDTYKGLPGAFADTLPDDFGNAVINAWLARQGRSPDSFQPIERLLYTGSRGMGALEYRPAVERINDYGELLSMQSLVEMAQLVLDERAKHRSSIDSGDALKQIFQVGTSAGGARPKALVAFNKARTEVRSGQMDIQSSEDFEHYLLKFDGVSERVFDSEIAHDPQGYGVMEYAYYLMARDAGIDMSPSEILKEGSRAHFMTKRFDRDGNEKLHYQSLCAMDHADFRQPGAYSYEQLFSVARRLRLPRIDAVEIYRRMVFNIVARNQDDHTKNVGFMMDRHSKKWRLSPAFDIAFSYKKGSPWVDQHQLSVNGKRDNFVKEDLLSVASLISNFSKEANQIIERVTNVVHSWPDYAKQAGVADDFSAHIQKHHRLILSQNAK